MPEKSLAMAGPSSWLHELGKGLTATGNRWSLLVFGSSIFFAGVMFDGYAVFDELAVYVVLAPILIFNARQVLTPPDVGSETRLSLLHRYVFLIFAAYFLCESIRGMFALPDFRVIRFAAMFAALGVCGWLIRPLSSDTERMQLARVILICTIAYFCFYVLTSAIYEIAFDSLRFDLQGHLWLGTTAAVVPGLVAIPALLVLAASNTKLDRNLVSIALAMSLFVAFYCQSRLLCIALIPLAIAIALIGRYQLASIFALCYLVFIAIFPWTDTRPLVPDEFARYVTNKLTDDPGTQLVESLLRFSEVTFGSFVKTEMVKKESASKEPVSKEPGSSEGAPNPETITRAENYTITSATDVDRKLALLAVSRALMGGTIGEALLGTGYYTHRFILLPYFHEVEKEYHYQYPETYQSIVRTATFNGMLIDGGIIGMLLFFALFGLTWLTGLLAIRDSAHPLALGFALTASLTLIGFSLFVGPNYDMLLLYFAVMPFGPIAALFPLRSRT